MSANKKQSGRPSVKKQTEKARAKQAQKAQKTQKGTQEPTPDESTRANQNRQPGSTEPAKGTLPPEKAVISESIPGTSKRRVGRKTKGDTSTRLRWPQILLVLFLMVILALAGLFSWDRWLRYDDVQDIKGEWVFSSEGNSVPVSITSDRIAFSSDIKFAYKMDPWAKHIEFNFTDLSGGGFYRFSPDRQTIYIAESTQEDFFVSIQVSLGIKEPSEGLDLSKTSILTKQNPASTAEAAIPPTRTADPEEAIPEAASTPDQ